jgi:hypothetical protein
VGVEPQYIRGGKLDRSKWIEPSSQFAFKVKDEWPEGEWPEKDPPVD